MQNCTAKNNNLVISNPFHYFKRKGQGIPNLTTSDWWFSASEAEFANFTFEASGKAQVSHLCLRQWREPQFKWILNRKFLQIEIIMGFSSDY